MPMVTPVNNVSISQLFEIRNEIVSELRGSQLLFLTKIYFSVVSAGVMPLNLIKII